MACGPATLPHARPGEVELVVVAGSSSDDTAERVRRHDNSVKVIETPIDSELTVLALGDARGRPALGRGPSASDARCAPTATRGTPDRHRLHVHDPGARPTRSGGLGVGP